MSPIDDILFEDAPIGLVVLDPDLTIRRCNETWSRLLRPHACAGGRSLGVGTRLGDAAPELERSLTRLLDRARAGATARQEAVRLDRDDGGLHCDVTLSPIVELDQVTGFLLMVLDVTERRHAERRLAVQYSEQAQLQHVLERRVE
ncbi:MAG: PAS domain-containing protein, partial [Chloroflexi bacterium]|nr:PAS domain-containing protein [Chloroflexota bacterium]